MKKRVRVLAVCMAVLMAVALLAGCGGGSSSAAGSAQASGGGAVSAADDGPFGKYDAPVTISVVKDLGQSSMEFPEGDSLENNVWTRYYADTFNIEFDWEWSTNLEQYDQKVNIAITSGDIPDLMKVKSNQLKMLIDNDQIMDITDIYDQYASDYTKEVMSSDGGVGLGSATFDGRLMALPKVESNLFSANLLWVRTDWLDALGLDLPETVEDFWAVAEAFTNGDPDGNGVSDTYGMALFKDLFTTGSGFASAEGFFNMYGAYPNIWFDMDGALVNGSIQPEAKDALAALQEMYAKGYIDPEFGVKDATKVGEDVSAGRAGMMFGNFWNMAWINDAKVANPDFEWVPVALPGGAKTQLSFGTSRYYVISKDCQNPEAVVKMLNGYLDKSYGEHAEPTVYNITPEGYGPFDYPVVTQEPRLTADAQMNEGELSGRLGLRGWPAAAEEAIVARDVLLAEHVGSRLHVCHVSTAGSVEIVRWAKSRGIDVTAEATPHHLLLTEDLATSYDPVFKVNPPLRAAGDVHALREALADGTIDVVATDHAPHPTEDKECEWAAAAFGMLGLEQALAVVIETMVRPGLLDWAGVADRMSAAPARIGRRPSQGRPIAVGEPANLVLLDLEAEWTVSEERFRSRSANSWLLGRTLVGAVVKTVADGRVVFAA